MAKKYIEGKIDAFKGVFKSKKEEDPFKKENQARKDAWARQKELDDMRLREEDKRNGWPTPPPSSTNYGDSEVDPDPPEGSQVDPDPPELQKQEHSYDKRLDQGEDAETERLKKQAEIERQRLDQGEEAETERLKKQAEIERQRLEKQAEIERQRLEEEQAKKERLEQEKQAEIKRPEQERQDEIKRLDEEMLKRQAKLKRIEQKKQAEIERLKQKQAENERLEREMQASIELFKKREREKTEQIENFLKSKNSKIVSVHQHQNTDMVRVFMGLVILTVVILVSLRLLFPEYFTQLAVSGIVLLGTLTFLSYWMKMTLGQRGPKKLL